MRPMIIMLVLLLTAGSVSTVGACGDKFLVSSRGQAEFGAFASLAPSTVLIFRATDGDFNADAFPNEFVESMERIGHEVYVIDSIDAVSSLPNASIHLVLTGIQDAERLRAELAALGSKPTILPLLYEPEDSQLERARQQFGHAFSMPASPADLFTEIDEIILMGENAESSS